ncbi:hypothetical protein RSOLAG1IB_04577 [Rhizoctonia solani AG-1 IB]|uniref:Uncharacterized protein n=2 Tax=Rhizoctonia solani TaxID=456999 RepID=M5BPV1_THACB|nr:unnamed protein product [Rhizoctonia solani]CCO28450.1 hypothetical protein BN14_02445 [Rhizoctonia solani AG-1 IB]CEL61827.1 hypothetical protein RSOLAG1IB_04577 [Rhizoctonia solani AG-1 IB]
MSLLLAPDQGAETASKRYQRFESCIYVASQSCSTKWTWDQFVMCFPTWVKEEASVAGEIRMQISRFMKDTLVKESSELLRLYEARTAIDALDEAIVEAKKRQVEGENNHKDEWKPDIDPRTAVRARVMPVLEKEQAELQKELSELEEQNRKYIARIQRNRAEYRAIDQEIKSRLNRVEQIYKIINSMDSEELQQWMLAADEAGTTTAD